jgi:hypothetical protein
VSGDECVRRRGVAAGGEIREGGGRAAAERCVRSHHGAPLKGGSEDEVRVRFTLPNSCYSDEAAICSEQVHHHRIFCGDALVGDGQTVLPSD